MRSSNKRRCLLTRCSATTIAILAKSAQSTASHTTIAGVFLFLHSALPYWARGEASRKAYQMKLETEASIDTSMLQALPPTATRRENRQAQQSWSQWHFPSTMAPAVQWNEPDSPCTSKICCPKIAPETYAWDAQVASPRD